MEAFGLQKSNLNLQDSKIDALSNVNLKNQSDDELMDAAKKFEAVFVNQLFQAMDNTIERDKEGMFSGGRGEEMFRSMFYDEIAQNVSSEASTSFGFAKQMYEQMKDLV